jgi:hypothetical protein
MAIILKLYNLHRPDDQLNALVLLQAYLTDSIPVFTLSMIIPIMIRLTTGPMSWALAELFMMIIFSMVCLLIILAAATSALKLLLVVKFSLMFSLDPKRLAQYTFYASLVLAFLPNTVFTCWVLLTQNQCCSTITVAYFVNCEDLQPSITFTSINMLIWLLMNILLLGLVVFGIPTYLERAHSSTAIREKKMPN